MKVKNRFLVSIVAVALVFSIFALPGCGLFQDDKALITNALTEELNQIKNLDDDMMETMLASDSSYDDLEEFGVSGRQFIEEYLAGFDFSIEDVVVDGNTATATLTLTIKKTSEIEDALYSKAEAFLADESNAALTQDEFYAAYGKLFLEVVRGVDATKSDAFEIVYTKSDGAWTPTSDVNAIIAEAMSS
jgi:hypothetical protein